MLRHGAGTLGRHGECRYSAAWQLSMALLRENDMMPRIEECCGTAWGDLDADFGVHWYTVLLGGCDGTAQDKVPRYNVWKLRRHGHGVNGSYTDQRFSVISILEESTLP